MHSPPHTGICGWYGRLSLLRTQSKCRFPVTSSCTAIRHALVHNRVPWHTHDPKYIEIQLVLVGSSFCIYQTHTPCHEHIHGLCGSGSLAVLNRGRFRKSDGNIFPVRNVYPSCTWKHCPKVTKESSEWVDFQKFKGKRDMQKFRQNFHLLWQWCKMWY